MAISTAFSTALTGLKTHQTALDVTSNNISNASNPDYVRQRAVFSSLPSINSAPGDIGTGVEISSIYRITDTFLFNRYASTSSTFQNLETQEKYLKEIATYFPDVTDSGLYKNLEDFFNAWQTFASNPNDGAVKVDLAAKTQTLTDSFNSLKKKLSDIQKGINEELDAKIAEANTIIKQIADLNKQITLHEADNVSHANELRDKRDSYEKRLKELLDVKIFKNAVKSSNLQGEESMDYEEDYQITLGGYPLIDNSTAHEITTDTLLGNVSVKYERQDFNKIDITSSVKGGEIGALLSLRGTTFDENGNPTNGTIGELAKSLDSLASGLIRSVNSLYSYSAQESVTTDTINYPITIPSDLADKSPDTLYNRYHILQNPVREGNITFYVYDNNGEKAQEISVHVDPQKSLNDIIDDMNDAFKNNGADIKAELINGQIKFIPYDTDNDGFVNSSAALVKDDGALLFRALNEIEYMPLSQINTTKLPLPLKNGSFDIAVYNSEGDKIATRTVTVNLDSSDPKYSTIDGILAQINTPNVDDNENNNSSDDTDDYYKAEFLNGKLLLSKKTDQNTYIGIDNDSADFGGAFGINKFFDGTDASDISLNSTLEEDPALIKASKTPNSGDNSVANSILQLQYQNITFYKDEQTSQATIYGYYREITADLANTTQTISTKKETTQTVLNSIKNEYYSLSGVNIDEELINLEKFQRGYQANAKVITTINQMLDALLSIK